MEYALFNPEFYIPAITNKRYNPNKKYDEKTLLKMTPKNNRDTLKNILMLDNAFQKYISICSSQIAGKYDLGFLYPDADEQSKSIWADFIISYQTALRTELIRVEEEIADLKQNLGKKQNNKKFERLSFYKDNLNKMVTTNFEDLANISYQNVMTKAGIKPSLMVDIANLYRHAQEYLRMRNQFYTVADNRGMNFNKEKIHTLLKNLDKENQKQIQLQEIHNLYQLVKKGDRTITYENKKLKNKPAYLSTYISCLDTAYLRKINILQYLEAFYKYNIREEFGDELRKIKSPQEKFNYIQSKMVFFTRNHPEILSKTNEIINITDRSFFAFRLNNNLKLDTVWNDQLINQDLHTLEQIIPELTSQIKKTTLKLENLYNDKYSEGPAKDKYAYTMKDFYNDTKLVDPLFVKIVEKPAPNENNNGNGENENNGNNQENFNTSIKTETNIKNEILKDSNIVYTPPKQPSDNLPKVDPNLPLDQKIDAYFSGLIGLNDVKQELLEIIAKKLLEGKNYKQGQMHMAFLGNPGTGKTTVARIVGKILHENGLINSDKVVECKFSDLYQNYVGFSAKATQEKIKEAEGGVLFIDEAHQLTCTDGSSKDFRKEIINVLVPELENNKNLLVIFAGYSKEMREMLKSSDKGLFSRVSHLVNFKDFSREDISKLFKLEMSKKKNRKDETFTLTEDAESYVEDYIDVLILSRHDNFANGREVRVLVNKILNKFGVIALNRKDIKTIDGETMKEILTSSSFENEILTGNEQDEQVIEKWTMFKAKLFAQTENCISLAS